jgi:O-antigen/teichoic acid export membrane protein
MIRHELLAKRIGLIAITKLLIESSNLVLLPILTKSLSISDYGIWVQIMVTIGLIPAITLLGLPFAMVRFLPSARAKKDIQETFYSIALTILILGFSTSIFIFLLALPIAALLFNGQTFIVQFLSIIVFIECLITIPINYFIAVQQIKNFSAFSIAKIVLNVSLVAYFVLSGSGIFGAMLGILISSSFIFFAASSLIIHELGFVNPACRCLQDYLAFGLPTVPGNLSGWIVNSSDRYVIALILGTAAVGYYSPGYTLGNIITIFIGPFSVLLPSILSRHFDKNEMNEVEFHLRISMKFFLILAIPSAFGLSLLSEPILVVLTTPEIAQNSYLVTPFVALSAIFYGTYSIFVQVIMLEKKTVITGWIWIIAASLNLGLNFLTIPYFGILGAALSTLVAFAFAFAITAYYANKGLKFHIQWLLLAKSIIASLIMSLLIIFISPVGILELIVAIVAASVLYFLVLLLLRGMNINEITFLRNLFS